MEIHLTKPNAMDIHGECPVRKIVIDNHPVEQVHNFNYLGCTLNYACDRDDIWTLNLENLDPIVEWTIKHIGPVSQYTLKPKL